MLNTEEKFLGKHQNFELLVSSIKDYAIFLLDISGTVASWSKGAESMKGFTASDIIGQPTTLFYTKEDILLGLPKGNLHMTLQSGHLETEGWRLRKDRSRFYANIVFTALYDKKHKHYGYAVVTKDITKRKETEDHLVELNNELAGRVMQKTAEGIASEEKLSTGEAQFRRTLDNMLEGIQIHDREWRYIYVNQALVNYGHYSSTELMGFTLMEKYPGIEQTDLFTTLQRCMDERLALHFETEFVFPDGIKKDFQLSIQPVPEGIFILSIDITKRKKAEEKLVASENNYRNIMERVSDGFVAIDRNWQYTYVNKKGADILRHSFEELINKNMWESFPLLIGQPFHAACYKAMEEQHDIHLEEYYAPLELWVENNIYPSAEGLSIFFRDITERKMAEKLLQNRLQEKKAVAARLRAIINTIPAGIALLDEKGIIIDVNDVWLNGTGSNHFIGNTYSVGDNYLDRSRHNADEQAEDRKIVAKGLSDVLSNKIKEFIHEYDCNEPVTKKCYRMIATPLLGQESAGAVVMHIDITELRRLEQEKLDNKIEQQKSITRAMLQAQEKERNHLGLELHDNVSQLLAAIKMKLQYSISGNELNIPAVRECIEHVEETLNETRNLAHQMVMPRFADSSFVEAIELLVDNYTNSCRTIKLEAGNFDENKVPHGIKETLYRVLQEQMNNIEKYAQAGTVLVHADTDNDKVSLLVKDNGVGFDKTKKPNGIGMINIQHRAQSYNGSAVINSAPGKGCTLIINIPLQITTVQSTQQGMIF